MRHVIAGLLSVLAVGAAFSAAGPAYAQAPSQAQHSSGAQALVERLHAPCCHEQLLDGHDSQPARALRQEIHARLDQGASPDEVERELVRRYGAWIVAVPKDGDPRAGISIALVLTLAGSAIALTLLGLRWVRKAQRASADHASSDLVPATGSARAKQLDARLEAELRHMDE